MTKKRIKPIIWILVLILVAYLIISCFIEGLPSPIFHIINSLQKEPEDPALQLIRDFNIQLYSFGDHIVVQEGLEIQPIDNLDPASFPVTGTYEKSFFIINDRSGSLTLSEEQIEFVRALIYEKHMPVMYFGVNYLTTWDAPNPEIYIPITNERGQAYEYLFGQILTCNGFWTDIEEEVIKQNPTLMGQIIAIHIENYIRDAF